MHSSHQVDTKGGYGYYTYSPPRSLVDALVHKRD
jgi:hypothetical protein